MSHVLFVTTERFVNVIIDGVAVMQLGVNEDGTPTLIFGGTDVAFEDHITNCALQSLTVECLREKRDQDMALPRWERERVSHPEPPRRTIRYRGGAPDTLSEGDVESIVDEIVLSYVREPNQSKARTSQITHELAKTHDMGVMQIAGVRAALRRGAYGHSLEELIRIRARKLIEAAARTVQDPDHG